MEKKQTAMMQLKAELKQSLVASVFERIEILIDKAIISEREQIEAACIYGINVLDEKNEKGIASEYYTQTFKP